MTSKESSERAVRAGELYQAGVRIFAAVIMAAILLANADGAIRAVKSHIKSPAMDLMFVVGDESRISDEMLSRLLCSLQV